MKYVFGLTIALSILATCGYFFLHTSNNTKLVETEDTVRNTEITSLKDALSNTQEDDILDTTKSASSSSSTVSKQITTDSKEDLITKEIIQTQVKKNGIPTVDSPSTQKKYIEIVNPSGFVNTNNAPITIGQFVGKKVILLNIMTYSCSNCQATFPYVNKWYEQYKDEGLSVIGLHTPEFAFEKDIKNVEEAMLRFGITYPVVMDNEYATWNAYNNRFWPRKYLFDIHGNIVYDHIGEGAYEETEVEILKALVERKNFLKI